MTKISLIIPVFQNNSSLNILFEELDILDKKFREKNVILEIIFVDDGSTDQGWDTLLEIKKKKSNITLIKHFKNYGAHYAGATGINNSSGDLITILPADLQEDPDVIYRMFLNYEKNRKLVISTRKSREDSFLVKFTSNIFYFILRKFVLKKYPKKGFDVFLAERKFMNKINFNIYNPSIQMMIIENATTFEEIESERSKRVHGFSQWNFRKRLTLMWDIFTKYGNFPF